MISASVIRSSSGPGCRVQAGLSSLTLISVLYLSAGPAASALRSENPALNDGGWVISSSPSLLRGLLGARVLLAGAAPLVAAPALFRQPLHRALQHETVGAPAPDGGDVVNLQGAPLREPL